jgi:molybdate transport system regulatory protein
MQPRFNLWIEMDDQVVLSRWRVKLLDHIQSTGSISAAAAEMQVPYRRAWEKVHEMEERLGRKLVDTEVGGAGGGGAELTPLALDLVRRFHTFESELDAEIEARFQRAFNA